MTSATSEVSLPVSCRNCSSRSQDSEDDIVVGGGASGEHTPSASPHPLNFRSLHIENGKKSTQLSPTNSNSDHSSTNKKCRFLSLSFELSKNYSPLSLVLHIQNREKMSTKGLMSSHACICKHNIHLRKFRKIILICL